MTVASARAEILVIDDDAAVRSVLSRYLSKHYSVETVACGKEALESIRHRRPELLLVDIGLPDANGIDLVSDTLAIAPDTAIIMMSGRNDATLAALCMQRGALNYLTKPLDIPILERAVAQALCYRQVTIEGSEVDEQEYEALVRDFADLRRERDRLRRFSIATLEVLVNALEAKDPLARGHSVRVADLSASIATELGMSEQAVERIRTAGRLHDIGYIGVRDDVLSQKEKLSARQYEHIKDHVLIGVRILEPIEPLRPVATLIRGHHERWDGNGYPDGIAGTAIPLGSRILGAAEVYDGLTRDRPDREKYSEPEALSCLQQLAGTALDPTVVQALTVVVQSRRALTYLDD